MRYKAKLHELHNLLIALRDKLRRKELEIKEKFPLSDSQVNQIAFDVRDGVASKQDARRLLAYFCQLVEQDKRLPRRLLEHLRQAFHD